jgi:hypothetical protein
MDELIILIIRGIAKLLGADNKDAAKGGAAAGKRPPPQPSALEQLQRQLYEQQQRQQQLRAQQAQLQKQGGQPRRPGKGTVRPGRRPTPPTTPPRVSAPPVAAEIATQTPTDTGGARAIQAMSPTAAPAAPISADATTIHRWLNPLVLRKQFILTEVLQPPLALRDDHRL